MPTKKIIRINAINSSIPQKAPISFNKNILKIPKLIKNSEKKSYRS